MLPEGFKLAPEERISEELKEEVGDVYFQPYGEGKDNVYLVGPLPGEQYKHYHLHQNFEFRELNSPRRRPPPPRRPPPRKKHFDLSEA